MMGDDMAIRSNGMYGNPESPYTLAMPGYGSGANVAGAFGKFFKLGFGLYSNKLNYEANQMQIEEDLKALRKEKEYNIANFKQSMADTFAKNKMSFYASGLEFSGTPMSVTLSNQKAMQDELDMMIYNYRQKERSLTEAQRANKRNLVSNTIGTITNLF